MIRPEVLRSVDPSARRGEAGYRASRKMDWFHPQPLAEQGDWAADVGSAIRAVNADTAVQAALGQGVNNHIWGKGWDKSAVGPRYGSVENKNAREGIATIAQYVIVLCSKPTVENKNAREGIATTSLVSRNPPL